MMNRFQCFTFNFNLRRYVTGRMTELKLVDGVVIKVGRCWWLVSKPVLKAPPLVSALEATRIL